MKSLQSSPIGVGVLSILTVLLVLILAVLSALTYASARADLALSQKNAANVAAYYTADSRAKLLQAEFAEGLEPELEAELPMTEAQSLYIHLRRAADGSVEVLAWKTVSNLDGAEPEESGMHLFDGTLPEG